MLNRDRVISNNKEKYEEVCDSLEVKEDLFCEEEFEKALKCYILIKPPYKKYDKSEYGKYGRTSFVSVGGK